MTDHNNAHDPEEIHESEGAMEPKPLESLPAVQALSWVGGVMVGGVVVSALVLTLLPSRTMGATRAYKAKWQRHQSPIVQADSQQHPSEKIAATINDFEAYTAAVANQKKQDQDDVQHEGSH